QEEDRALDYRPRMHQEFRLWTRPPGVAVGKKERVRGRNVLGFITALYTLFVIYGSLVPLTFHPRPLADAWAYFLAIPYLNLGIESRADWVRNIVVFLRL